MRTGLKAAASKRIIIVGAGMAGLTAAAYLSRAGHSPLILEMSPASGGLVGSFSREGFVFDAGPRAIGNAGALLPMLDDLGIKLRLQKGQVSTGIKDHIIHHDSPAATEEFIASLKRLFPAESRQIDRIARLTRRYTRMAATLNAMPNPFFRNPLKEPRYLITRFLPWLPGFLSVVLRSSRRTRPVEAVLADITNNQPLIDMISQHFFKGTPANFALGYFANFQDYLYPQGGTGSIPQALTQYITAKGGRILTNTKAVTIDARQQILTDDQGTTHPYDALLWTADLKSLYRQLISPPGSPPRQDKIQDKIQKEAASYTAVPAGESVFTIFLAVDSPPESFSQISHGHFIYTPKTQGLGSTHRQRLANIKARFAATSKNELLAWLRDFCALNAYEISIPALKDPSLAPPGKTGLVISLLMDGELCTMIDKAGWFAEFKKAAADYMIETLEASIYPGLAQKIIFRQTATPLTIMERFASDNGAITGWSLEAPPPVPATLAGIMNTPKTAIPAVYKAGQWAYSPSGVPIAILTGRIAAWAIRSALKKRT